MTIHTGKQSLLYQPLRSSTSTRLFDLQPGAFSDTIEGNLREIDLAHENTDYEAVSYAWGSVLDTHTIHVNGLEVTSPRQSVQRSPTAAVFRQGSHTLDGCYINNTDRPS
jgi:hypothetical protein